MIRERLFSKSQLLPTGGVLSGVILAALAGYYIAVRGLSYREPMVFLGTLLIGIAVLAGSRGVQMGFGFWPLTFMLGYRSLYLTSQFTVHPAEILIWSLLGLLLIQRSLWPQRKVEFWLPRWLWLFTPFLFWGWVPGLIGGRLLWDQMFSEFRNFLILIPCFIIAATTLRDNKFLWRPLLLTLSIAGAYIGGMGFLEYQFPSLASALLPGFISDVKYAYGDDGFVKATFAFWGTSDAVFVCALSVPVAIIAWRWWTLYWQRLFIFSLLMFQLVGIYISGHRSMWLMITVIFLVWTWLSGKFLPLISAFLFAPITYPFLPSSLQGRILSLVTVLGGRPDAAVDSSGAKRWDRALTALDKTLTHPWGDGWSSAGWVHSDFIQVAANLGLLAGLVFFGAYLITAWSLWQRFRSYPQDNDWGTLGFALFLSFIVTGGLLMLETIVVLPQFVLPAWFIWTLADVWLRQDQLLKNEEAQKI